MARENRSGIIRPIKTTVKHTLKDGTVKTYHRYRAKVGDHWVSGKTYKQCDEAIKKELSAQTEWGKAVSKTVRLGPYAEEWLAVKKTTSDPSTYRGYMTIVRKHLKPYADKPVSDFTPTICRRIIRQMQAYDQKGKPTGSASMSLKRTMHTTLNQIFKNAVADRIMPSNPMTAVDRPTPKDNEVGNIQERQAFTVPQMHSMLNNAAAMGTEQGAIWWWRLLTGMRQGEILGAGLEDLRLDESDAGIPYGSYAVNWKLEQIMHEHGCGQPVNGVYPCCKKRPSFCTRPRWRVPDGYDITPLWGRWCLTRPKSKTGRVVPIIPILAQVMQAYLKATANQPNPYGLIFHRPDGKPIEPDADERAFRNLMRTSGIPNPDRRTGHESRHAVVTLLSSLHVDLGVIMQVAGHGSMAMVEHYRHIDVQESLRAIEPMGDALDLKQIQWTGIEPA